MNCPKPCVDTPWGRASPSGMILSAKAQAAGLASTSEGGRAELFWTLRASFNIKPIRYIQDNANSSNAYYFIRSLLVIRSLSTFNQEALF